MSAEINDPVQCCEAIGKWLVEEVPEAWDKIVVDFKIIVMDDVSERTIVYTPSRKSSLERQFSIRDTDFTDLFYKLARLTSKPDKGLYKSCRYTLAKDGTYSLELKYDD